jgi:hypothetical protein
MKLPEPFSFSQSSLQDYQDCALRFQLRYIEHLDYPAMESEPSLENELHIKEGELFHRLVQQHLLNLPNDKLARLANTPNLQRWWDNFLTHKPDLTNWAIYPEFTLSAPLRTSRLLAKFDLIAISSSGQVRIYDWKTYRKRPKNEWLVIRWQTRVYRALLAKAGTKLNGGKPIHPESIEMIYWFPDFHNEPAVFPYNSAQYQRDWDALEKIEQDITASDKFERTENEKTCLYCTYRSYCDRGKHAGNWEDAESEAEALETFDINFEQIGEIAF